jgi:hypothetical protein
MHKYSTFAFEFFSVAPFGPFSAACMTQLNAAEIARSAG